MKTYAISLPAIIITGVIMIVLLLGGWKLYSNKVDKLENKIEAEVKLRNALADTITTYQNKEKEWVSEKLTIQGTLKDLEKTNVKLTQDQKYLIGKVNELNKDNTVIAAALIKMQLRVDSLLLAGGVTVDTTKKTVGFIGKYANGEKKMNYNFTIGKVLPAYMNEKPTLTINLLEFPNTQTVDFHWKNNKKEGYPVAFSVSNSNDFYKTVSIDSYVIPEINKEVIKPTGWKKIGAFFKKSGDKFLYVGIGAGIGVAGYIILTK